MKSCGTRQADLKAYLDGELPAHERLAMWLHLLQCAKCREAKTAMTEISRRVGEIESDALPAALRARILSSVNYTDNLASGPAPERVGKHRVRPPLILVGGATAAALFAVVLMRPLLFPPAVMSKTAAPITDNRPSSSNAAAPAMPSASKEMQQPMDGAGKPPTAFAGSSAAAPPAKSAEPKEYYVPPVTPPVANSAPTGAYSKVAKPMRQSAGEVEKSAADSEKVDGNRAMSKPQNAPLPDGGRRLEDYMNSYPADRVDAPQHIDGSMARSVSQSAQKKEAANESRKQKARAKAQAQRNARSQRSSPSQSAPAASSK